MYANIYNIIYYNITTRHYTYITCMLMLIRISQQYGAVRCRLRSEENSGKPRQDRARVKGKLLRD